MQLSQLQTPSQVHGIYTLQLRPYYKMWCVTRSYTCERRKLCKRTYHTWADICISKNHGFMPKHTHVDIFYFLNMTLALLL